MQSLVPSLLLLLTAVIWGAAFVAQRLGMDHVGPWTFGVARNLLGFLALLPVIAWRRRCGLPTGSPRALLAGSLACGAALFAASMAQQVGLQWTSAGLSGFLTANYVLLVPVFGCFIGRPPLRTTWVGVALALTGLFLISVGPDAALAIGRGEALTLLCAALFAVQILCVDRFAPRVDPVALAAGEFLVSFVAGLRPAFQHLIKDIPVFLRVTVHMPANLRLSDHSGIFSGRLVLRIIVLYPAPEILSYAVDIENSAFRKGLFFRRQFRSGDRCEEIPRVLHHRAAVRTGFRLFTGRAFLRLPAGLLSVPACLRAAAGSASGDRSRRQDHRQ